MLLSKIKIKNYRLLVDTELNVDDTITLIVGRNNFAYILLAQLMRGKMSFNQFCDRLPTTSIDFMIDYSLDDPDANLSALSTFIIDVDEDTTVHIQTFLTSHSAHIANTVDFSRIRYAQECAKGVIYKDLNTFSQKNESNMDFIKKYLTLSRCDLFFADKGIFVEGASERLLLPDIIRKCDEDHLFDSQSYKLPAQYYTLVEIGGAYAYKFIPFVEFLGIPCLILTDIDAMLDGRTKAVVSKGKLTSNTTLYWWMRRLKNLPEDDKSIIDLAEIIALSAHQKTLGKCHLEFQVNENGLCGRSLEEAIQNVNRAFYGLNDSVTEEDLKFLDKSKTDFALNLIFDKPDYIIPKYIIDGLVWLNNQKVLI